jgi:ketosteroid isomerase-like protein
MRTLARTSLVSLAVLFSIGAQPNSTEQAIRNVLEEQQAAWNRGDIEAFMSGYDASESTTFVGATITRGYQQVLDNYRRRYPNKAKMGHLTFSNLEVHPLEARYALVIGKWHLDRQADAGGNAGGIFTLLFKKTAAGWKIVVDHTS